MSMKKCPTCGAELEASLVDAITNPSREESCPKAARNQPETHRHDPVATLAAYMLLGHLFTEGTIR